MSLEVIAEGIPFDELTETAAAEDVVATPENLLGDEEQNVLGEMEIDRAIDSYLSLEVKPEGMPVDKLKETAAAEHLVATPDKDHHVDDELKIPRAMDFNCDMLNEPGSQIVK